MNCKNVLFKKIRISIHDLLLNFDNVNKNIAFILVLFVYDLAGQKGETRSFNVAIF